MSTPAASRSRTFAASRAASPSNIIVVQSFMILLELARPADESPCEVTRVSTSDRHRGRDEFHDATDCLEPSLLHPGHAAVVRPAACCPVGWRRC